MSEHAPASQLITDVWISGQPRPKGSMRLQGRRMVQSSSGSTDWQRLMSAAVRADMARRGTMMVGPAAGAMVSTRFVMRKGSQFGDSDKLLRNVLDALTGVAYVDDVQVVTGNYARVLEMPGVPPGAHVVVHRIDLDAMLRLKEYLGRAVLPAYLRSIGAG